MEKQLDYLAKKEEELRALNDVLDRKKDEVLRDSVAQLSPKKESEEDYSEEEEANHDDYKGKPMRLEEDEDDLLMQAAAKV